jgi:hypothetical protein
LALYKGRGTALLLGTVFALLYLVLDDIE